METFPLEYLLTGAQKLQVNDSQLQTLISQVATEATLAALKGLFDAGAAKSDVVDRAARILGKVSADAGAIADLAKATPVDGQNLLAAIAAQALLKALRNGDLTKEELLEALNGALFVNPRTSAGAELFTDAAPGAVKLNGRTTALAGKKTVAVAGTPENLGNQPVGDGVYVVANPSNAGAVYVFPVGGAKTAVVPLYPGDSDFWPVSNINALQVDADVSGDSVYWKAVI